MTAAATAIARTSPASTHTVNHDRRRRAGRPIAAPDPRDAGRAQAPDRREFEELVMPHRPELFACAMRYTRNPRDAEDLVQETLLRALAAWPRFIRGSNARAWAFRILTNSFINGYRRRRRHRRFETETPDDAMEALYGDERPRAADDPEEAMVVHEMSDEVVRALASLTVEYRQVVLLADVSGLRYRDIAARLRIPVGTVMSRLFRARRQLEAQLAGFAAADYGIRRIG
jgi:RNA polymerase sigma-70 factor (ECF subfamily)